MIRESDPVGAVSVVEARALSKSFGGRIVLDAVDINVLPGEVHGLLGQNGSGKSTLIKILSGYYPPDADSQRPPPSLHVRGEPVKLPLTGPEADALGLAFVHQDLGTVLSGTVLENLRIGRFDSGFGWRISWRKERLRARGVLAGFGLSVAPDQVVSTLSEVERALLAILRGLERLKGERTGLLVLDEPTAYLPRDGVEQVFAATRSIAAAGHGVLFVTHRLDEALAITDRVSVLRDGRLVLSARTSGLSERELVKAILGLELDELYPERVEHAGQPVLQADALSARHVRNFSLTLREGEIVGLTGLVGAGHEEVPYLLFGATHGTQGRVTIGSRAYEQRQLGPRLAISNGVALLPGDRRRLGGVGAAKVFENVTLPTLRHHFRWGALRTREERTSVRRVLDRFQVQPQNPMQPLGTLSGGNQQKALLGKWFKATPKVLLLHEPTQGVDIGAKQAIFRIIRDAADEGMAIVVASAEYEDLANICHRVVVLRNGRPVAELRGPALTEDRIVEQAMVGNV